MSSPNTKADPSEVPFRQVSLHHSVYYYLAECMLVCFIYITWVHIKHCCELESCSWGGVFDTTLCDKVCQWIVQVGGFLLVHRFPQPVKLTATIWLKYCWKGRSTPLTKLITFTGLSLLLFVCFSLWSLLYSIFDPMTYFLRESMCST